MTKITLTVTVPDGGGCEGCSFFMQFSYRDQPWCALFSQQVLGTAKNFTKCIACIEHATPARQSK